MPRFRYFLLVTDIRYCRDCTKNLLCEQVALGFRHISHISFITSHSVDGSADTKTHSRLKAGYHFDVYKVEKIVHVVSYNLSSINRIPSFDNSTHYPINAPTKLLSQTFNT